MTQNYMNRDPTLVTHNPLLVQLVILIFLRFLEVRMLQLLLFLFTNCCTILCYLWQSPSEYLASTIL